jgi:tetratricopeptide (TPR) repeat protein
MRLLRSLLLFCFALTALPAFTQDWKGGQGRLEGKVVDSDGKPLEGVNVRLDLPGRGGTTLKTDKKGHWAILGLADGTWNLDFQFPGYVMKKISAPVSEGNRIPPIDTKLAKVEATGPPPEVTAALQDGDNEYKAGHYPEARASYEKLLAMRPDLGKALQMQIARCYKMEGNITAEIEHLQTASTLSPGDADIKTLMAMEALNGGLMDQASELFKQVDESTIKSPDVFYNIGVAFLNKGKSDEAITYFGKAITLDPNYVDGYFQRGLTYFGMQKLPEAKADFQKVMTLAPQSPQAETAKKALASIK